MAEVTDGGNSYQCGACGTATPPNRDMSNCPKCYAKIPEEMVANLQKGATVGESNGSVEACVVLGVIALCAGLYFLINPDANNYRDIANMHALAMGQAFTVAGAILLGFGIRPR